MVTTPAVIQNNARFAKEQHTDAVCVFAGATKGIGLATLKKLAAMLYSSTFYVLGRSPSGYANLLDQLKQAGPSNSYIFIEVQVSLISSVDAACLHIASMENKVDYICMSTGGMPWQGAVYTSEGLETCFAISYYSRLRLVSCLLPLLHQSPNPRILSILNGTREKPIDEHDIGLYRHWSVTRVINHTTLLTSLAFDYLAAHDNQKHIVFLHASPGLVYTGSPKQKPTKANGWLQFALLSFLRFLSRHIVRYIGMSLDEAGERHAFLLTSAAFTPGSWRVNKQSDAVLDNATLVRYQQEGWAERIWEYTELVWDKALSMAA